MSGKDSSQELDQLKAENEKLRSKLDEAAKPKKKHFHFNGRTIARRTSFIVAGGIFVVASIIFYIAMTLVNTERFMTVAGPLVEQPAIQAAITQKTTDALFEKVEEQVESFTKSQVQNILASDRFQQVWETSLSTSHERFITALDNYEGDGTISITDVYNRLSERLDNTKLSFLANKTLPSKIGNITVIEASWLPTAHALVSNINTIRILTISLFFGLLAIAIWLSNSRRRTIITIGTMISSLSLLMLIFIRIVRNVAVGQVDTQYQAAATEAWTLLATPFAVQLIGTMLFGLAIITVAWLGGRSKSSVAVRRYADQILSGRLHQAMFNKGENTFSLWIGQHLNKLLIAVAVVFVLSFLFIQLSIGSILLTILIAALVIVVIQAVAAPSPKQTVKSKVSKPKTK